jgi:hypothetical protein
MDPGLYHQCWPHEQPLTDPLYHQALQNTHMSTAATAASGMVHGGDDMIEFENSLSDRQMFDEFAEIMRPGDDFDMQDITGGGPYF